jgi:ferredoxin
MRCVVACKDIAHREALGFVKNGKRVRVGTVDSTLKKSGCKYCSVCVEVCPTGALRDSRSAKKTSRLRQELKRAVLPPEGKKLLKLSSQSVGDVPASAGVYTLFDTAKEVIQITGAENLQRALLDESENERAAYYTYEVNDMVMMRERQMIQQHVDIHGELPVNNREIDELF